MITTTDVDMDRRDISYWLNNFNASYSTGNAAFTGTDGKPVGSGEWNSMVTGVNDGSSQIPDQFSLANNYPNPFNPSTVIKFGLPQNAKVKISVYNILGQLVTQITNEEYSAGIHSVNFSASGISSGIYIYSINAVGENGKQFNSSKKMLLLK
jgi:Secretion system C-terminal sorting domain